MRSGIAIVTVATVLFGASESGVSQVPAASGTTHLCYVVESESGMKLVPDQKVRDQFGRGVAHVLKPRFVCNPVDLTGRSVPPQDHILCYEANADVKGKAVAVRNQFQPTPAVLELGAAQLLCVTTEKRMR